MRAIILGALLVASGALVTGCKREQNTQQQPQQAGQPAAPPSAPSGTGGAGNTAGSSDATGGGGQAGASQPGATGGSSSEQGTAGKTSKPKSKKKAPKTQPESPSPGGPTSTTGARLEDPPADPPADKAAKSPQSQEGTGGAGQVSGEEPNPTPEQGVSGYDAATEPRTLNPAETAAQEEEAIGGSGAPQSEEGVGGSGVETEQIPLGINPELPSPVQGPIGGQQPAPGSVGTQEPLGGAAGSPGTLAVQQSQQPGTGGSGPVGQAPLQGQRMLTVEDPLNGIYSVAVQPNTCVSRDGKAVARSDLNPGDTVRLQWRMQNGKRVASWVDIVRDVPRDTNPGIGGSGLNQGTEGPDFDTEGTHAP